MRTQSLNVLRLKPGVVQYTAIHAILTARDFFLAYFYPSSPFTFIFHKTSPDFFHLLAVATTGFCVESQNKIGHPACRRQRQMCIRDSLFSPQWGAADAEVKVPSGENTELKRSPFKVWGR